MSEHRGEEGEMVRLRAFAAACGAGLILSAAPVSAADYPAKPIRLIVPYSAGGANDLVGRAFGDVAGETLGQPLMVENRTGGAGLIGSGAVARADPDGYTLLVSGMPSLVLSPAMAANAGFDSIKDFTHIAYLGGPPNVLVAHASLGIRTFKEFVEAARKTSGLQYVSPSVGSVGNVVAEYMAERLHLKLSHVAYRGGGSAVFDLIAGHVKLGCLTFSTTRPHIEAGKLIPLAISTEARLAEFPDLPTVKELGIPELVTATWYSLSGPAGLTDDIVRKLNGAFNKALADARVKKLIADEALQTKAMTPQEITAYMQAEIAKWSPLARKIAAAK
jgi:tripartite-type tricarboxylate transporter receptor subunit TctC